MRSKKTNRDLLDACITKAIKRTGRALDSEGASLDKLISCISSLDKLVDREGGEEGARTGVVYLPERMDPPEGVK